MTVNEAILFIGKPAALFDTTHPDWVPALNLGYGAQNVCCERYERQNRRKIAKVQSETACWKCD